LRLGYFILLFFFFLNIPLWKRIKKDGEGKGNKRLV